MVATPDFQQLFERSPNLYLVLDPSLTIVAASDAYCAATLTKRNDILGRHLFAAFPDNPEDPTADGVSKLRVSLERVLRSGKPDAMPPQKYDIQRQEAAGGGFEERYWSPLNSPVLDDTGAVRWIIHRVEDITDHVHARNEGVASLEVISQLRQANAALSARNVENERLQKEVEAHLERQRALLDERLWLRAMVDHVPDYLFVKDRTGRFIIANKAITDDLAGGDPNRIIGKTDFDLHAKERAAGYSKYLMEVLRTGVPLIEHDEVMILPDGRERRSATTKVPLRDASGSIVGVVGIARDVTARRRAEEASEASDAMARRLLDASPDTILVLAPDGTVVLANHQAEVMYGYPISEIVGASMAKLVPPRLAAGYAAQLRDFGSSSSAPPDAGDDLFALRSDGTEFPVEVTFSAYETSSGPAVIVAVRDVTERKAIERQLRQSQKMEAIGNLTGGLAHDFNNLLSVVIGNLDLVLESPETGARSEEFLRQALEAALQGADLTSRLLAFARRQPLQPTSIDVNGIVENTTKLLSRTLPGNITIELKLGQDVWPVVADPTQLEASIINIMTNARDAMPDGGKVLISTSSRALDEDYARDHQGLKAGDYSAIEISDTGTGMPADVLAHIFEPFYTTKEEGKGTGLGLSMVFGFMKQSGGHINVYSEVGVGTTFRLFLPRSWQEPSAKAYRDIDIVRSGPVTETILVVEDNPRLRRLVVQQLTELGYKTFDASDGPAALALLEKEAIDLMFSDIVMPGGMSGYALTEAARARWPGLKVLLTSGFPEEKLAISKPALPTGIELLSKPYRKSDLAVALRRALDTPSTSHEQTVEWTVGSP